MRKELHDHLCRINPDKNWDFIINQVRLLLLLLLRLLKPVSHTVIGRTVQVQGAGWLSPGPKGPATPRSPRCHREPAVKCPAAYADTAGCAGAQIGMFSFTGLTPAQVENMTNKHQV